LLVDTCFIGALCASLTWIGVWNNSFSLLPRGFLYNDPYDVGFMLVFSSVLYAPSACAAILGAYSDEDPNEQPSTAINTIGPCLNASVIGLAVGIGVGSLWPGDWPPYGVYMLCIVIVVAMTSHALIAAKRRGRGFKSGRSGGALVRRLVNISNYRSTRTALVVVYIGLLFSFSN
jgi:hypothetical protein